MTHTPEFALIVGVVLVAMSVFIAWTLRKHQRTASEYYLAGRRVTVFQNASAISGDYISAASFLGVAGLVFLHGYDGLHYAYGFFLGFAVVLFFIAGPLRKFGHYTIPDFVGSRFHTTTGRAVAVICVLVISLFYVAPQMLGAGKILLALVGIPYPAAVALVAGSITLYVVLGGMQAATINQVVQFWVILTAILVVSLTILGRGDLSFGHVLSGLQEMAARGETETTLAPLAHYSRLETVSLLIALVLGTAGLPHILVRLYTNPDRARARWSAMLVLVLIGTFYLVAPYIGFTMRYLLDAGVASTDIALSSSIQEWMLEDGKNLVVPAAALRFGGELGLALVVAGALSAVLSTAAGLLVVMSAALGHDLYYSLYNPQADERTRVLIARGSTVVMGAAILLLGLVVQDMQIAVLVGLAFAVSASTVFPVLVAGLWWRRMTARGAVAGMLTGLGTSLLLIFGRTLLPEWLQLENPGGLSVLAAFSVLFLVSKLDSRVPPDVDHFMAVVHGTMEEQRLRSAGKLRTRRSFAGLEE
ncbi:MAG: cation acetate symporter [Thermoleophilia bacterium]